jgi:hypothetical protein
MAAAQRHRRTVVQCIGPECKNTFECPSMHYAKFRALLMSVGWAVRGSQTGPVYHCSEHPPVPDRGPTNGDA